MSSREPPHVVSHRAPVPDGAPFNPHAVLPDHLPITIANAPLAPPLLDAVSLRAGPAAERWSLFHGTVGAWMHPTQRVELSNGEHFFAVTFDSGVGVNYAAKGGLAQSIYLHQFLPEALVFGQIDRPAPDGPGLRIALPEPTSLAVTRPQGYFDRATRQMSERQGYDGFISWDTVNGERQHLTVHVRPDRLQRLNQIALVRHDVAIHQREVAAPTRTGMPGWMSAAADLLSPRPDQIQTRHTVEATVLQMTGQPVTVSSAYLPAAVDRQVSLRTTPWGVAVDGQRALLPGVAEVYGGGRVAIALDASAVDQVPVGLRERLVSHDGAWWTTGPEQVRLLADALPHLPRTWSNTPFT